MVLNIILDSYNRDLILAPELSGKERNNFIFNLKIQSKFLGNDYCARRWNNGYDYGGDGVLSSFFPLFQIMILNLDIKADIELRGSGFYLCSQDYGTLCFLPSDRDTQIPHGRPLSTAWSSAECHWHRSPSNRSKSSTPATVRPLGHQPQPNKHIPSVGKKKEGRQKWEEIFRSLFSLRLKANKTDIEWKARVKSHTAICGFWKIAP